MKNLRFTKGTFEKELSHKNLHEDQCEEKRDICEPFISKLDILAARLTYMRGIATKCKE